MASRVLVTNEVPGTAGWSVPFAFGIAQVVTNVRIPAGAPGFVTLNFTGLEGNPVLLTFEGNAPDATLTAVSYEWNIGLSELDIRGNALGTADVFLTVVVLSPLAPVP